MSTLSVVGLGHDARRSWPPTKALPADVLFVARVSARGMSAASRVIEVWLSGSAPSGVHVLGLIAVAAGPKRPPQVARDRFALVSGWMPRVWQIPWVNDLIGFDREDAMHCTPLLGAIPKDLRQWLLGRSS